MKKTALIIGLLGFLGLIGFLVLKNRGSSTPAPIEEAIDLPINVIPLVERPFITLSPDASGRSLNFTVANAPTTGDMEYELVYQSVEKQEGVFGRLSLATEKSPITKSLLLGSKSGGGKVTYHEGVTGGSLTVTYNQTRLKESWNFLTFDPSDPTISSTDAKFHVTIPAKGLTKGAKIVTLKTFGYPKAGLPAEISVKAGPYAYYPAVAVKGSVTVELKLPEGDHTNPTLYEWNGTIWKKLLTKLVGDAVTATATGQAFLVITE